MEGRKRAGCLVPTIGLGTHPGLGQGHPSRSSLPHHRVPSPLEPVRCAGSECCGAWMSLNTPGSGRCPVEILLPVLHTPVGLAQFPTCPERGTGNGGNGLFLASLACHASLYVPIQRCKLHVTKPRIDAVWLICRGFVFQPQDPRDPPAQGFVPSFLLVNPSSNRDSLSISISSSSIPPLRPLLTQHADELIRVSSTPRLI
jgi:hypothetical protein